MRTGLRILAAAAGLCLGGAGPAGAQGFTYTYSLGSGSVAVSNSQVNSSWVVLSVMLRYPSPCTGTAEVTRVSQGVSVLLGRRVFTNVTAVVWVPEGAYSFGCGDSLVVSSNPTNGVLQVTRRGE